MSAARLAAPRRPSTLLVARGDAEDRDDLGLVGLGVDDVGAGAAAEPAGGLVVADEDAGVVLAVAVLDPDLVALLESVLDLVRRPSLAVGPGRPHWGGEGRAGSRRLWADDDQVEVGVLVGAFLSRVWTSIALGLAAEVFVWA